MHDLPSKRIDLPQTILARLLSDDHDLTGDCNLLHLIYLASTHSKSDLIFVRESQNNQLAASVGHSAQAIDSLAVSFLLRHYFDHLFNRYFRPMAQSLCSLSFRLANWPYPSCSHAPSSCTVLACLSPTCRAYSLPSSAPSFVCLTSGSSLRLGLTGWRAA